ncbi:DsbC family protein [Azotobacter beijerinckii]|uniref:DsbC family protein n=1 Tax=Azotobacter beijerinckii TaxID=170623 RepID=UPI002955211F|nr:DsbC family protein [Azotobacter beijerinckii]MDV7212351.1 DsbC family protein [Azotobacter beijerinckii]
MRQPLYAAALLSLCSLAGAAFAQPAQAPVGDSDSLVMLPATALFAIEKNGKFAVMTDTGRFIVQGTVYDVWAQRELKTLADVRQAVQYVPVDKTHLGFGDLAPLRIGHGDRAITLFADPACTYCKELMQEARTGLPEGYRLEVLMLPLLTPRSARRTQELHCAEDPAAAWQATVAGDLETPLAQKPDGACDLEVIGKRRLTAQFLGARNVPYLIRDDGLTREGKPAEGLRAWIEARQSN